MALKNTNLTIQMAPIPATFKGSPQDLAIQMLLRMKILSPSGSNFIFIGDTEPTSNVGPWLKDGTKWYVWSDTLNQYIPLDISDSFTIPFFMGSSIPTETDPQVWLQTTQDATDLNPSHGAPISWNVWTGSDWVPFVGLITQGSIRPAAPVDLQQFYDTTIGVLIWWERGQWRTVSGVQGDIKAVIYSTLQDALDHNPGWALLGTTATQLYGRTISQATQDPGLVPVSSVTPGPGVTPRAAFETYGEDKGVTPDPADTLTLPAQIALWHLFKT